MMEELIVRHCSPTMAGLKTGNLFNCQTEDPEELVAGIRQMNRKFVPRGIRLIPVKYREGKAMMYMYRPAKLEADLADQTAREILSARNYPVSDMDRCVAHLIRCLNHQETFPHEIGLFLGYPPEDVEKAKYKFARFKKCTRVYCEAFQKYHSFDRLVVSCS